MTENLTRTQKIYNYVAQKIAYLESIAETGLGKATLAKMRRGIGKQPGEIPELWWVVFDRLPEELMGKNKASSAEWAIYTSLTLYALHRQGGDKTAYCKDVSLGSASSKLVKSENDIERILNRLNLVTTSTSPSDLAYYLKSIIQLFKNEGILLDYALLAKDLYLFSSLKYSGEIKLKWGRNFYGNLYQKGDKDNE